MVHVSDSQGLLLHMHKDKMSLTTLSAPIIFSSLFEKAVTCMVAVSSAGGTGLGQLSAPGAPLHYNNSTTFELTLCQPVTGDRAGCRTCFCSGEADGSCQCLPSPLRLGQAKQLPLQSHVHGTSTRHMLHVSYLMTLYVIG